MKRQLSALRFVPSALATLLVFWSLATPWAAAFPDRADHYKITLFGVRHVNDMTAQSAQTSCSWGDVSTTCRPSANGGSYYIGLTAARWLVLIELGLLLLASISIFRGRHVPGGALLWGCAFLAAGGAVLLVRMNVVPALDVFAGARPVLAGSGMIGALLSAGMVVVAALVQGPRLVPRSL